MSAVWPSCAFVRRCCASPVSVCAGPGAGTTPSSATAAPTATRGWSSARSARAASSSTRRSRRPSRSRSREAFEKKYGIKVVLWRALSDQVVQRAITEAQGRRHAVDVIETNGPEMEMLAREKLLGEIHSPYLADLPAGRHSRAPLVVSRPPEFLRRRLQHDQGAARRDPGHLRGLCSIRSGRGRIALEATDAEWMATLIKTWGDDKGMDYFRKLVGAAAGRPHAATSCWQRWWPRARCRSA